MWFSMAEFRGFNKLNRLITADEVAKVLKTYSVDQRPKDIAQYQTAFVHTSYVRRGAAVQPPDGTLPMQETSYERMELLGDTLMSTIVTIYLMKRYPECDEGFLSRIRTRLINGKMQASISRALGFGKFMIVSDAYEQQGARENIKLLEDTFEAFLAAIFNDFNARKVRGGGGCIDGRGVGFQVVETWLVAVLEHHVDFGEIVRNSDHNKERLSKHALSAFGSNAEYVMIDNEDGKYTVIVKSGDQIVSSGTGDSKKEAEQSAAKAALQYIGQVPVDTCHAYE
jgi:ribonuclease III